jgi:hypothetical protein
MILQGEVGTLLKHTTSSCHAVWHGGVQGKQKESSGVNMTYSYQQRVWQGHTNRASIAYKSYQGMSGKQCHGTQPSRDKRNDRKVTDSDKGRKVKEGGRGGGHTRWKLGHLVLIPFAEIKDQ